MKQVLICFKDERTLLIRYNLLTDIFVPIQDVISPQKTTFKLPLLKKVEVGDVIIIKDNSSGVVEYIGYVDTNISKEITEIACYPMINMFDNDFVLDQLFKPSTNEDGTEVDIDVDVVEWLETQITRAFIYDDDEFSASYNADVFDELQAMPFIIRNNTKAPVLYKKANDTSNLLEVYTDLFIETGVYVVFSDLQYNGNRITGIYCDIYNNRETYPYQLRWDAPSIQKVDITDNTFTNYNKLIVTEKLADGETREPIRYYFYLLNNNEITTDAKDSRRIKQVRSKEISFDFASDEGEEEGLTEEEKRQSRAESLILTVYNELQAPEYNLKIEIEMIKNDELYLYRRVDFFAENGIKYTTNITQIEKLNDLQVKITLGALRNSLTDFKKKVEAI